MRASVAWMLAVSVLSVPLTLTHVIEDFSVGIHERFELTLLTAAYLVSLVYMVQVFGAILSARGHRLGHLLNLLVALVWLVGGTYDHLGEVLLIPTEQYRAGLVSQALSAGVIVVGAIWTILALAALRRRRMRL